MVIAGIKLGAVGAAACAALLAGGSATETCPCKPPETETISCTDGVVSWAAATCTQQQMSSTEVPHLRTSSVLTLTQVVLSCPDGETAISAGFRPIGGPLRPLVEMTPVVPQGSHPQTYRFLWRSGAGTDIKTYITCQRV